MPSFQDSAFLVLLALLLFGPKGLAKLARELGKLMGEFRRASNEFRLQMDEEFRLSEQEEQQKKIAAIEAAAPVRPAFEPTSTEALPEPEHPHGQPEFYGLDSAQDASPAPSEPEPASGHAGFGEAAPAYPGIGGARVPPESAASLPIASNGALHMMPPATGLPTARSASSSVPSSSLSGVFDSIPQVAPEPTEAPHNG